jgi:hypothetical protein
MRKINKISAVLLCFSVFISGCSKSFENAVCQYSSENAGNLGDEAELANIQFENIVNKNYVTVEKQNTAAGDFNIALTDFFYDGNTGFIIYKLEITNLDNSQLTEEQRNQFKQLLENGEIEFTMKGIGYGTHSRNLMIDSNGNTSLFITLLLSGIDSKDKSNHITDKNVKKMTITYENEQVSTFDLPGYTLDSKEVWRSNSNKETVISLEVSELGMNIIWNTTPIIKEFKEKLKEAKQEKGKDFNEENYGYTVFEDLSITFKDGTVYQINSAGSSLDVLYEHTEEYEKNKLYSYSVLFNAPVDIQEIDYITIDGIKYYESKE